MFGFSGKQSTAQHQQHQQQKRPSTQHGTPLSGRNAAKLANKLVQNVKTPKTAAQRMQPKPLVTRTAQQPTQSDDRNPSHRQQQQSGPQTRLGPKGQSKGRGKSSKRASAWIAKEREQSFDDFQEEGIDLEQLVESAGGASLLQHMRPMSSFAAEQLLDEPEELLQRRMNSVLKIFCVHTEPNFSLPWQRQRQSHSSSSGFAVEWKGKRLLLTNAHSVEYHSQVKVKKRGDGRKFVARVLAIGRECDIALLTVDDEEFWDGMVPLQLGDLPRLQDSVAVVGYPIGGETISITVGVVSRIEVTHYVHGSLELLGVQIDAAINSGNSGGPVFNDEGQCVGIAFQSFAGEADNIGYVIPTPVVKHFLEDFERNDKFTGFPTIGVLWQQMDSEALRQWYGMSKSQKGVLVRACLPTAASAKVLKAGDVLMEFDGTEVACDGTVPFRFGERIAFSYLISQKFTGETARLKILREGKEMDVEVELTQPKHLVPPHINNNDPSYFIISGLVFTVATDPYLSSEYGSTWESPVTLQYAKTLNRPEHVEQEVVLLSQVLACDATIGYEDVSDLRVQKFNGKPIMNLRELAREIQTCTEEFMHFHMEFDQIVVLRSDEAQQSTEAVLKNHNIAKQMSDDIIAFIGDGVESNGSTPVPASQPASEVTFHQEFST